jgi:CO dehydrogenase/acetyl-CoA synthase beta subunit
MSKNVNSMVDDLVGTLTDPIIVYPGGWGDSLPEWLKNAITLERLTENMKGTKGEQSTGTDAEACAYLNTASLTAPMDGDWSQIYLYIAGKTYTRWQKNEMPDDIRVESLTDQQTADLSRLKEWLYHRRTTARQEAERNERRQQKEEEVDKRKAEQPALFEF